MPLSCVRLYLAHCIRCCFSVHSSASPLCILLTFDPQEGSVDNNISPWKLSFPTFLCFSKQLHHIKHGLRAARLLVCLNSQSDTKSIKHQYLIKCLQNNHLFLFSKAHLSDKVFILVRQTGVVVDFNLY